MAETSLRERKKQRSRELLVATALDLFTEHGFDAVTVDQIAEGADVSPRTFFRYFGSKEAVLFADQDEMLELLDEAIRSRPADEVPLTALRHALVALAVHYEAHREQHLRRARVAETGAAVAAYQRTVMQPLWEATLTDAIAARLGVDGETDLRPRLFAGVAVAVMSSARVVWLAHGGTADVPALLHRAFEALELAVLEAVDAP